MVALPEVIASNKRIATTFPDGLVAVFVGGTSGVGEYTLKAFAKYAPKSRVYIVGRSQEAAYRIIEECKQVNPGGKFTFIKGDVSLMNGVDDVCRQIQSMETTVNLLFESQGSMEYKSSMSSSSISLAYKAPFMCMD
jgi:NADP-dependent 3-hydroxy acid dehydrogenase YdfG